MKYVIQRYNDTGLPAVEDRTILHIAANAFSRDTAETDFLLLVSYVLSCANRDGNLPCVHLSDDSGSGHQLAVDIIAYLRTVGHHELSARDESEINRFAHDIIHCQHDSDMRAPPKRLVLGSPFPYHGTYT